jgi:hypothetical protein
MPAHQEIQLKMNELMRQAMEAGAYEDRAESLLKEITGAAARIRQAHPGDTQTTAMLGAIAASLAFISVAQTVQISTLSQIVTLVSQHLTERSWNEVREKIKNLKLEHVYPKKKGEG